jgi:hypothetical protein
LNENFKIKLYGHISHYLGVDVDYHQSEGVCHLSQAKYIRQIVEKYGYTHTKVYKTPMAVDANLTAETEQQATAQEVHWYAARLGSLNYPATKTRPDIAFAVSVLGQFTNNPNQSHWKALERVFGYLKGSANRGLTYRKGERGLHGYVDSDWGGDPVTRRSTTGYVFMMYGSPVSWSSKRQQCVALSSTEAEYIAACEAAKEAMFLMRFVNSFLPSDEQIGAVTLLEDNIGCIKVANNPEDRKRTKHIDLRYHYLRDKVTNGEIILDWVQSANQLADGLTKALSAPAFEAWIHQLGLTDGFTTESD